MEKPDYFLEEVAFSFSDEPPHSTYNCDDQYSFDVFDDQSLYEKKDWVNEVKTEVNAIIC